MRLFIAINLSEKFKDALLSDVNELKKYCDSANYTPYDNFHLTLAFIGETQDLEKIKKSLDMTQFKSFEITLDRIGNFDDIYIRNVITNMELVRLEAVITENLERFGVTFEKREFKPHITLARRVRLIGTPVLPDRNEKMTVDRISLMRSDRISGQMVYTEIYFKTASE